MEDLFGALSPNENWTDYEGRFPTMICCSQNKMEKAKLDWAISVDTLNYITKDCITSVFA